MYLAMKVPAKVGMKSLIGTASDYPLRWGNYFWLADPEIRVLNFWAENLEEAVKHFLPDGLVQIRAYEVEKNGTTYKVCIIDDDRIPKDWYYQNLCFTGGGGITKEIAESIFNYIGDPNLEMEQWTDIEMYYARRRQTVPACGRYTSFSCKGGPTAEEMVSQLIEKRKQQAN